MFQGVIKEPNQLRNMPQEGLYFFPHSSLKFLVFKRCFLCKFSRGKMIQVKHVIEISIYLRRISVHQNVKFHQNTKCPREASTGSWVPWLKQPEKNKSLRD